MKNNPATWITLKVGDIVSAIEGGISATASDHPATGKEHGILTLSAVSYSHFDPTANKAVTNGDIAGLGRTVRAKTVLISRSNTVELVGACVYVDQDFPKLHLPDLIWQLSLDDSRYDPRWFYYALTSPASRVQIQNRATGTSGSMKKLSMGSLRTIELSVPPFSEQKAIAAQLAVWDCGIRQIGDLIAVKLSFKQWLMQQLLSGKRRFREFTRPDWAEHRLDDLFDERAETNRIDLPLLSITADRGVISREDVERKDTSSENKSLYRRIAPGDIGYNTMRMWQGVSAVSSLEGIVSPAYTICIPRPAIDAEFAGYLFKYPPIIHQFLRHSQGMVDDTLNLKFHHFAQISVHIPSVAEQKRIVAVFKSLDKEIELLNAELEALKKQKKGLMQLLLTGKVRVKT